MPRTASFMVMFIAFLSGGFVQNYFIILSSRRGRRQSAGHPRPLIPDEVRLAGPGCAPVVLRPARSVGGLERGEARVPPRRVLPVQVPRLGEHRPVVRLPALPRRDEGGRIRLVVARPLVPRLD